MPQRYWIGGSNHDTGASLLLIILYCKMRHPWCNFALMKKCRNKIAVRKMTAQQQSNFAVSPSGKPPRTGCADLRSRLTREGFAVTSKY